MLTQYLLLTSHVPVNRMTRLTTRRRLIPRRSRGQPLNPKPSTAPNKSCMTPAQVVHQASQRNQAFGEFQPLSSTPVRRAETGGTTDAAERRDESCEVFQGRRSISG